MSIATYFMTNLLCDIGNKVIDALELQGLEIKNVKNSGKNITFTICDATDFPTYSDGKPTNLDLYFTMHYKTVRHYEYSEYRQKPIEMRYIHVCVRDDLWYNDSIMTLYCTNDNTYNYKFRHSPTSMAEHILNNCFHNLRDEYKTDKQIMNEFMKEIMRERMH